jgi:tetratricopeptide (TPR) repeat protein
VTGVRYVEMIALAMAIAVGAPPVMGQRTGAPPPGSGGGRTPGTPNSPTTTGNPQPTATPPELMMNRGLYFSGKVVLEDGTPPPDPVTIERVCGSVPRAEAYTDSKGRFDFQMGQEIGVMQDASQASMSGPGGLPSPPQYPVNTPNANFNRGGADYRLMGCELRASLPGYRSDTINLSGRRAFDNPNVGTIVLHRLSNVEGSVISMTSLAAPKDARKAYEKAREELKKNKPAAAEKHLLKAVSLYPKYAAAWFQLGWIQQHHKDLAQARESYAKALAADAKFITPYLPLTEMAAVGQDWQAVADLTGRAVHLDPVDYPQMYFYNAAANFNLGRLDAAAKSAQAGKKLDTARRYPKLDELFALILARQKDYSGALEHLRAYLEFAPAGDVQRIKNQIAELERLSGANPQAATAPAKEAPAQAGAAHPPQ